MRGVPWFFWAPLSANARGSSRQRFLPIPQTPPSLGRVLCVSPCDGTHARTNSGLAATCELQLGFGIRPAISEKASLAIRRGRVIPVGGADAPRLRTHVSLARSSRR